MNTKTPPQDEQAQIPQDSKTVKKAAEPKRPIIADGKTLDELVEGDRYAQFIVHNGRAYGATDEEIWEFL